MWAGVLDVYLLFHAFGAQDLVAEVGLIHSEDHLSSFSADVVVLKTVEAVDL